MNKREKVTSVERREKKKRGKENGNMPVVIDAVGFICNI